MSRARTPADVAASLARRIKAAAARRVEAVAKLNPSTVDHRP